MLAFHVRSTLYCGAAATPVPLTASDADPDTLLNNTVPFAVPLLCGVNVTEYDALCPAASVFGSEMPESTNSELLLEADEIVTLAPLALSEPLLLTLDPTVTLPKDALLGESVSCPEAVPVPVNGIETMAEFLALYAWNEPVTARAAVGENAILNV